MSKKSKSKRRILWSVLITICTLVLAVIVVPPMINLNSLKPHIENSIFIKTGVPAKIKGDVNFSLLWHATIVAHDISVPNGVISSCEFTVPFLSIFNLEKTDISGDIYVNGASLFVEKIVPFDINANIVVKNSQFKFLNKTYDIISANLSKQSVSAIVRTDQHKYEIKSLDNNFTIKNKNNELNLSGTLYPDGSATAHISIIAQNINKWFEFKTPQIRGRFPVSANMKWNGSYGIEFTNISANGISGSAILQEDGYKIINFETDHADYDISFILNDSGFMKNTTLNLNLYGKIKFLNRTFKHLRVDIVGDKNKIKINEVIADDLTVKNGYVDENGAHDVNITLSENGIKTTCLFSGSPNNWSCKEFSYGDDVNGEMFFKDDEIFVNVSSQYNLNNISELVNSVRMISNTGIVNFAFANMSGTINIKPKNYTVEYKFANDKNLNWANIKLPFLPDFMLSENGDFVWSDGTTYFVPKSQKWYLSVNKDKFVVGGNNLKNWVKNIDLQTIIDLPYMISGNYKNGNISDLELDVLNQKFVGSASDKTITLKTDMLNIDSFLSKDFKNNYEQLSFFIAHPITIPFELPINISLVANTLIYNGYTYNNFVYSSRNNTQLFSITDSTRGNILATLKKDKTNYDINIQLNKFAWDDKLLSEIMPLNLSNTTITAEIKLKTSGKIAHDLVENINGTFDASFDGGNLYGLGISDFYASAQNITLLNAEYVLPQSLESGITPIKKMRMIGTYDNGDIKTTKPLALSIKHTDISGMLDITNNKMFAKLNVILRGTSPDPTPIELIIKPDGSREYSLSDIMLNFDSEYMRTFIQTHNKF